MLCSTLVSNGWNFANVFERIAETIPTSPAQMQSGRQSTWCDFDRRSDGLAATLLAKGAQHQDKIAQYLYNGPEYIETFFAACKIGMVAVNTNHRYGIEELAYLWDNADVVAVVFHGAFGDRCAELRSRLSRIRTWLWVDDGSGHCPAWAEPYEAAAARAPSERVIAPWGRSGEDLLLLYTGGTTGLPKGVMWRQDDLLGALDASNKLRLPDDEDLEAIAARLVRQGPRNLAAAPLMHGTGLFNALSNLAVGGSVVTMSGRHFDAAEVLSTIAANRVTSISIVGDAFAKPILKALDAEPDRWDISSLRVMVSSGVMWSSETKSGLLKHNARLMMVDTLGSSEAIGMATSTTNAGSSSSTASFKLGPNTRVINEAGAEVVPGSGERGRVAVRGRTPVGYYKDPEKSASTFQMIDGVRYSIPGDWAEVSSDRTVRLLGRGSQCINTGGEKVYPEEVEEVLKLHAAVRDAAVVGLHDEQWGEAITALIESSDHALTRADLVAHVKSRLAAYKAPKHIIFVDSVERAANGKLDYRQLKARAAEVLSTSAHA